jgi:hypothetical protein
MYIHFSRAVHETLAEAIAADEILGDRQKAEAHLIFAAQHVSRHHGGMFPSHGILILPEDFSDRPELADFISHITGGLVYETSGPRISPHIINSVNVCYNRK